jgi:AcrR family transcriptional regulator
MVGRMLQTPWGDADTLRERRLPPGRSGDRGAARRDQRERLFAALVASCDEKGYDATSVEDLLRTSGVSRATFYEQFDDKLACFRAAQDEMLAAGIAAISDQLDTDGDPDDRPRAALEAFVNLIVEQPAAARMCLVGSYAAGTTGIDQIQGAIDWIIRLVRDAAEQMSDRSAMPAELLRGIIGGLYQVIYGRLRERREAAELPDLVPGLWKWVMSFPPPPRPLRRPGRLIVSRPIPTAPPFASYSAEQRIIRGFAVAVAAKGYPGTTIADIAAAASISQTTFYEHFDGKAEALSAALESSGAQILAAVLPAIKRTADWKVALRVGFEELCGFLASEPAFASLRAVDVYGAGPTALASRDYAGTLIVAHLVEPAYKDGLKVSQLELEASAGAIYGVLFEGVRSGHTADLPRLAPFLTYFALAPFIGAEEACETANGRGRAGVQG